MLGNLRGVAAACVILVSWGSTSFGDGSITSAQSSLGPQVGTVNQGTPGAGQFSMSSTRGSNGTVKVTYTVNWIAGVPAGVTLGGSPATFNGNTDPKTTLSLNTTSATAAGSYLFTITATDDARPPNMSTSDQSTFRVESNVPEIDPGAATGAVAVLSCLYLLYRDRRARGRQPA